MNLQYYTFNMSITDDSNEEKKEDIWLGPMTKAPTPPEKSKKQRDNIKTATKNFDYKKIANQLVWLKRLMGSEPSH